MTVGVLQASLALEEELSLKAQLQKLLTVAKNLFTHLGKETKFLKTYKSQWETRPATLAKNLTKTSVNPWELHGHL